MNVLSDMRLFISAWQGFAIEEIYASNIMKTDGIIFDTAALIAMMHWTFTPARVKKHPVPAWVAIPLRFKLKTN